MDLSGSGSSRQERSADAIDINVNSDYLDSMEKPALSAEIPVPLEARIMVHPDRPALKWRPLKALGHFRALMRDKEDTSQVFHIFQSLPRKSLRGEAEDYIRTDHARQIAAREPYLPDLLDDHEALRATPMGSVAHAYCDFMENEGLSAAGLVAEHARFSGGVRYGDWMEWYFERNRDTHDLLHVLTGYGRDALGEACVLAFTYGQSPAPAHLFISHLAALNIKRNVKSGAPVMKALREARRLGKACPRISELPITELLAMPLDEARAMLHIERPHFYGRCHEIWRSSAIDPYDLLGEAAAA